MGIYNGVRGLTTATKLQDIEFVKCLCETVRLTAATYAAFN